LSGENPAQIQKNGKYPSTNEPNTPRKLDKSNKVVVLLTKSVVGKRPFDVNQQWG